MMKFMYLYDNVVNWDDSAGEEAFHNAKKWFLAKMQKVDWDSNVDLELLSEPECRSVVPDVAENNEPVVIFGDSLLRNHSFSAAGWGECEDDFKNVTNSSSNNHDNWWEKILSESKGTEKENVREDSANNARVSDVCSGVMGDTGCGLGWDNSWFWNHPDDKNVEPKYLRVPENDGAWGNWDVSYGKNNNAGRSM